MTNAPAIPAVLDLDAERSERAKARAAKHEGSGETLPIRFGGQVIAELAPEFALTVLAPLTEIDVDISFILKQLMQAAQAADREEQMKAANLVVDLLVVNPTLPAELIKAFKEIARRVLGSDGYEAFTAQGPTPWDIRALAVGILGWYGTSLGEFMPASTSPGAGGGQTSKQISSGSTAVSTRAASGKRPAKRASSASAASSAS